MAGLVAGVAGGYPFTLRQRCPDCQVGIGEEHREGCDWALCLHTGEQRLLHELAAEEETPGQQTVSDALLATQPDMKAALDALNARATDGHDCGAPAVRRVRQPRARGDRVGVVLLLARPGPG